MFIIYYLFNIVEDETQHPRYDRSGSRILRCIREYSNHVIYIVQLIDICSSFSPVNIQLKKNSSRYLEPTRRLLYW